MTTVIKVGGARAVDPAGALADVAEMDSEEGSGSEDVVLVHGGSTAVDDTLERLGIDPEYVETPSGVVGRFTDAETMEVFEMVMPGLLNTELVASLQGLGVDAVGLSGTASSSTAPGRPPSASSRTANGRSAGATTRAPSKRSTPTSSNRYWLTGTRRS
jgi:acetylglutamate kinase